MSGQQDDAEKPFEATSHKLQEARKKGDVPRSQDLNTTSAYIGLFLALSVFGAKLLIESATGLMVILDQGAQLAPLFFEGSSTGPIGQLLVSQISFLLSLFVIPACAVILSLVAQRGIIFTPSKLVLKLSRISPLSNAKQKYGISGLFEFLKSFTKLVTISLCLGIFLHSQMTPIVSAANLDAHQSIKLLIDVFFKFFGIVIFVSAVIAVLDYSFQYFDHRKKLMMSRKEIQDESKEQEGDPYLKQERLQRGRERSSAQSLSDVDTADVVITNPTHYAVALFWSREPGSAPICIAKGTDEIARAIRERAVDAEVPIHEDPPTARALHATTEVGGQIPQDLYQAVATAVRFSEKMRQQKKRSHY